MYRQTPHTLRTWMKAASDRHAADRTGGDPSAEPGGCQGQRLETRHIHHCSVCGAEIHVTGDGDH